MPLQKEVQGAKTQKERPLAAWLTSRYPSEPQFAHLEMGSCSPSVEMWCGQEEPGGVSLQEHGQGPSTWLAQPPAPLTGPPGFLTGICGVAVGYPLDTVKVRSLPDPAWA